MSKEPNITKSTTLEKIAGSPITQSAATVIAAIDGGATAALLPVLATTLASERQKKRVDAAIADLNLQLKQNESALRVISDNQYKLINETVLTVLQTTCGEKIKHLKTAINRSIEMVDLKAQDAFQLSRLLRDISAEEVRFLIANFHYQTVQLCRNQEEISSEIDLPECKDIFYMTSDSPEGRIASGLVSLGLLVQAGTRVIDMGSYKFAPICSKLITLLR